MKDPAPRRRPDLMGGPDEPADVMEGGEERADERPDVMEPGESEEEEDVLDRGER
ncbi:MAG TPA: hypothetical protein VFB06_30620 [Streptosporangiaceae bacterium]|nr:hypothetical protein [Streptosporangiaceae bacterium]